MEQLLKDHIALDDQRHEQVEQYHLDNTRRLDKIAWETGEQTQTLERMEKRGDRIEQKVTQTNGRLGELEKWRSFITGGLTIMSILFVPVLLYVVIQWIS